MTDLTAALAEDAPSGSASDTTVFDVSRAIRDIIAQEALALHERILDEYAAFNPDRDTLTLDDTDTGRTARPQAKLAARARYLLGKANFERLSDQQIAEALRRGNSRGLRVKLQGGVVDWFALWVRGRVERVHRKRTWRHLHRGEARLLDVYRRLVLMYQKTDEPHVHIKMFKDIPVGDVEALLPHARVKMSLLDRLFVWGGGLGMVGTTASKVAGSLSGMIVMSRLLWVILFGATVATVRTVMGYKSARTKRISQRTQHLYYQNLSNNAGAIHTLLSMIAQEEAKEALLAYMCCVVHNGREASAENASACGGDGPTGPVRSVDTLRHHVEAYLDHRFGVAIDFDATDAVETLTRLGLWADEEAFQVVPPDQAVAKLKAHWLGRRTSDYHCCRSTPGM